MAGGAPPRSGAAAAHSSVDRRSDAAPAQGPLGRARPAPWGSMHGAGPAHAPRARASASSPHHPAPRWAPLGARFASREGAQASGPAHPGRACVAARPAHLTSAIISWWRPFASAPHQPPPRLSPHPPLPRSEDNRGGGARRCHQRDNARGGAARSSRTEREPRRLRRQLVVGYQGGAGWGGKRAPRRVPAPPLQRVALATPQPPIIAICLLCCPCRRPC